VKRITNPFRANETKQWTSNVYDESSRVKEVILPDGSKIKTDYAVSITGVVGVLKTITDQAGKKRSGISDALGRMVRVTEDPDGENLSTDYVFDTLGNIRKTIQGEQNRFFTYDSLGRLLFAKQPEQEVNTTFTFTDSITSNSQWSVKYEYDDNGNIIKTTDARGVFIQATYDNFNRLKVRDYSDSTPDVLYFYDGKYLDVNDNLQMAAGSVKGKTTGVKSSVSKKNFTSFDNLGRILASQQITDGQIYNFAYQYNLTALIAETYPSGRVINFDFNKDGDLSLVAGQVTNASKTYANSFNYNSNGAVESLRLGNGKWESAKYNSRQQMTQIGLGSGSTDKSLLKLTLDYGDNTLNNGAVRSQTIQVPTAGANQGFTASQNYTYDNLNRLQSATETIGGNVSWKQTFTYDRFGNRRFDSVNTTTLPQSVPSKVFNPLINTSDNRLKKDQDNDNINDYDYDKTGNVTLDAENKRFIYDAENRQTAFFAPTNTTQTPDAVYYYDGDGRRVKKNSPLETTIFVYDSGGQLTGEYSTALAQTPTTSFLTSDHLGSPRVITNAVGVVIARKDFSAFGDETLTPQRTTGLGYGPEEIRQDYTGYQEDEESSLEYAQARYYNASHGRFTSVDPLTASANMKNPQTFNRYSYSLNSPYKFSDPLGLLPEGSRSSGGYCGAEFESCTDNWQTTWDEEEVEDSETDTPENTPATESTESAPPSQEAEPAQDPPAPTAVQNEETILRFDNNWWSFNDTTANVPVSPEVDAVLDDGFSRMTTNIINAMSAVQHIMDYPQQGYSMTWIVGIEGGVEIGPKSVVGGNIGGKAEFQLSGTYTSIDNVFRDLKIANDKIKNAMINKLEGMSSPVAGADGSIKLGTAKSVEPYENMAVNFASLVRKKSNEKARSEYNKNYPERKGITGNAYYLHFNRDY
jgi:RHS repeat-associated protein